MDVKKVYYKHYRFYEAINNGFVLERYSRAEKPFYPESKGGKTECHLVLEDNSEIVGISECSMRDNFCYRIGREIARGRAMKKYADWLEQVSSQKADWFYTCTE